MKRRHWFEDYLSTSADIPSDLDRSKAFYFIVSGVKRNITMALPHTDLPGLLRGALAHKKPGQAADQAAVIAVIAPLEFICAQMKTEELPWHLQPRVVPQQSRRTAGDSHKSMLRYLPLLSYPCYFGRLRLISQRFDRSIQTMQGDWVNWNLVVDEWKSWGGGYEHCNAHSAGTCLIPTRF